MEKSYTEKISKYYFWQILSVLVEIAAFFVVTPRLTNNKALYGIFSIVYNFNIFFNYADLGFVTTGYKYASEEYAKGNVEEEIKITAFVIFIYFVIFIMILVILMIFAINPSSMIKDLNEGDIIIASKLLWILISFSICTVIRKFINIVLGVRVEQYILYRLVLMGNFLKVIAIYWFITSTSYNIVGYYLFSEIVAVLLPVIYSLFYIKKYIKYDFKLFFKSFYFSKPLFQRTKKLISTIIVQTIIQLLINQMDLIFIGFLYGTEPAGEYQVAFTITNIFKTFFSIIYTPYVARFNHLKGKNEIVRLKEFYSKIIILFMPFIIIPILGIFLFMKPFVFSWVGQDYSQAIIVSQWLILTFATYFFVMPCSIILTAFEEYRIMITISIVNLFVYLFGITIAYFFTNLGVISFAIFKVLAILVIFIFYLKYSMKFTEKSLMDYTKELIIPILPSITIMLIFSLIIGSFLPTQESTLNLIITVLVSGISILLGIIMYYVFQKVFRSGLNSLIVQNTKKTPFYRIGLIRKVIDKLKYDEELIL